MSVSTLREGDSLKYLRQKEQLAQTDSSAIYRIGENYLIRPVLIENGGKQLFVEDSFTFVSPDSLPGFLRYELTPAAREHQVAEQKQQADEKATAETKATVPRNWIESREQVAEQTKAGLAADKANRLAAQGTTHADVVAGTAMYNAERRSIEETRARRAAEDEARRNTAFARKNRR